MNHRRGSERLSTPVVAIKYFVVYLNSGLRQNSVHSFYGAVRSGVYVVSVLKACLVLVPFNDLSQPYFPGYVDIVLCLVSSICLVFFTSIIPVCSVFVTFLEPITLASAPYILQITLFCL